MQKKNTFLFFKKMFFKYPKDTCKTLVAFLVASIFESVGITAMLPLLAKITNPNQDLGVIGEYMDRFFAFFGQTPDVPQILILIVILICLKSAFTLYALKEVGYITALMAEDLRKNLVHTIINARWDYFRRLPVGRSSYAIGAEVERASLAYFNMGKVLSDGILVSVYLVFAFLVSWKISVIAIFAGFFMLYAFKSMISSSRKSGEEQNKIFGSLLSNLSDSLVTIKPIRAMGREKHFINLLGSEIKELTKARKVDVLTNQILATARDPILALMMAICLYIALTYTTISFSGILVISILFYRIVARISGVQYTYQRLVNLESSYWSLEETIQEAGKEQENNIGIVAPTLNHGVTLSNISFYFADSKHQALLKDVSLSIPAHSFTILVGPSGSGKTTLIDIIIGLYKPSSGEVMIDNIPVANLNKESWRQMIGYVPQDSILLNESIRNNIALGNPSIADEEIFTALHKANADHFVRELPEGLDTLAGERGQRFSGGQRQRLSIARALVHKPKLLILDEPTSALDHEAQDNFIGIIRNLCQEMTIIVITHSPSMSAFADQTYEIINGQIIKK